ncbi:MAG TPA: hypothetical protein PLH64_08065 [Anaerolineaceae bacterium]|nr:hypothetical protein [Anaerolineaceae bacterium]
MISTLGCRSDAGDFILPENTKGATFGQPGMRVMGGRQGNDAPPYQRAEFFPLNYEPEEIKLFLPLILR